MAGPPGSRPVGWLLDPVPLPGDRANGEQNRVLDSGTSTHPIPVTDCAKYGRCPRSPPAPDHRRALSVPARVLRALRLPRTTVL